MNALTPEELYTEVLQDVREDLYNEYYKDCNIVKYSYSGGYYYLSEDVDCMDRYICTVDELKNYDITRL
jgi:hypothetical protein